MKNMFKACLFFCLLFSVSGFSEAPESIALRALDNGIAHGVGAAGTFDSMWGFAYRTHFSNNIGVVANLGGAFAETNRVGLSGGVLFTLFHHHFPSFGFKESSIRVLIGLNAMGMYGRDTNPATEVADRHTFIFGGSVGPSVEYFMTRNFAVNVDMPWMTKFQVRRSNVEFMGSAPTFTAGFTYYI